MASPARASDPLWLDMAARLASRARPLSRPNPGVGCCIIRDGAVIGAGWTAPGGRPHAEAAALAMAGEKARGADIYTTLEPCAHQSPRGPSCTNLILAAGPGRVIIGLQDPDPRTAGQGIASLRAAGVTVQLIERPAVRASLAGYLTRTQHNRPYITLKLACSLDGAIALASGESQWITGPQARAHCHAMRARQDAILVGGATWRKDTPRLDVRLPGLASRSPERFVLSRSLAPSGARALARAEDVHGLEGAHGPVHYLYIEGGAESAAAFIRADLVDRLEIYRAPILLGGAARPMLGDIGLDSLAPAHGRWHLAARRPLGSDLFEAYERGPCLPESSPQ